MSKKDFYRNAALLSFALLLFVGLGACINGDDSMEVLGSSELSDTPRHENYPSVQYNPNEGEFLVLWSASGLLRDDCDPGDEY